MIGSKTKNSIISLMIASLVLNPLGLINECQLKFVGKMKNQKIKIKTVKQNNKDFYKNWIKPVKEIEIKEAKELAEKEKLKKLEQQKIERQKNQEKETQWTPVRVSYYTNDISDCLKQDGISASGKNLNEGGNFVSAPKDVPFGTKLYIQGLDTTFIVEDRGGAIVWENGIMKLDVYIPNVSQDYLNKLGVKYTKAKIIK